MSSSRQLVSIFLLLFTISFVSAIAIDNTDIPIIRTEEFDTNISVDSANFWDTNLGNLSGVAAAQFNNIAGILTIDTAWLDGLYCALTGCTMSGDINMGDNNIINVEGFYFNTSHSTETVVEGLLNWNDDDGTLNIGLSGGTVNLQVGQEQVIRVKNDVGTDILNGVAVYISGAQGDRIKINLADAYDASAISVLGLTTENITDGGLGYVTRKGLVRGVNTSAWGEGDKLYLNSSGTYSNHHPTSANAATIIIGYVVKVNADDGIILVEPSFFTVGNNFTGTLRQSIINDNPDGATGFTAVNDLGYFTTMSIAGSENAGFGDSTSVYYTPGYGEHWTAIDGDKDFVWFTDPTDSHNNSALDNEVMRLNSDGDLNVVGNITASGGTHSFDVGVANGNQTLSLDSGGNEYSCLELTEANSNGFRICNDGSGTNRLVFSNYHDGQEWMWIDRDDGTIHFLNTTYAPTLNVAENLTVDEFTQLNGDLNVTGNFTGNQIYGAMFYHNHTATALTFTAPSVWYPLFFTNATNLNGFSYVGGFGTSSNLTAQVNGIYQASYMAIGSGENNEIYLTTVQVNGIEKPECSNHWKMAAGGDVITQGGLCLITINVGDTVGLATQNLGNTGAGEYYGGNLNLVRVGN